MSKETSYSAIIKLPDDQNNYLRDIIRRVNTNYNFINKPESDFHITIEPRQYSPSRNFMVDLKEWLKLQNPFNITLNRIDHFTSRSNGLLFLTTDDSEERNQISDLHYGIHEVVKQKNPDRQNNTEFIPHITLFSKVPLEEVDLLKNKMREYYRENLILPVSEIVISKMTDEVNWQECRRFNLGGDEELFGCSFDEQKTAALRPLFARAIN